MVAAFSALTLPSRSASPNPASSVRLARCTVLTVVPASSAICSLVRLTGEPGSPVLLVGQPFVSAERHSDTFTTAAARWLAVRCRRWPFLEMTNSRRIAFVEVH
jgi:hypothetical protein